MATSGLGYVACAGQVLVGMAQPFRIPIDLPPGKPAAREHFLLEPTVGLHMWECSQDMVFRGFCSKCENIPRELERSSQAHKYPRWVNSKSRMPSGNGSVDMPQKVL